MEDLLIFFLVSIAELGARGRRSLLLVRMRMMAEMVVVVVIVIVVHVHLVRIAVGRRARRNLARQGAQRLKHFHRSSHSPARLLAFQFLLTVRQNDSLWFEGANLQTRRVFHGMNRGSNHESNLQEPGLVCYLYHALQTRRTGTRSFQTLGCISLSLEYVFAYSRDAESQFCLPSGKTGDWMDISLVALCAEILLLGADDFVDVLARGNRTGDLGFTSAKRRTLDKNALSDNSRDR